MKHEGGNIRSHGVNVALKGVSVFFQKNVYKDIEAQDVL